MADLELTPLEQEMLSGGHGKAAKWAIEIQIEVGEYFGARRLIPVSSALIVVGVEMMGDAGLEIVEQFAATGARFRTSVMTNVHTTDHLYATLLGQDAELQAKQDAVNRMLHSMGAQLVDTCVPYQNVYQPHLEEHLAWGDTGAVCYSNSVLGSRSNFEAGSASLAAALTGRVPEYGFHLDDFRRGTLHVSVQHRFQDLADWGALGMHVGYKAGNYWQVPIFSGLPRARADELKHLAAAVAACGSVAMFGVTGQTPEAATLDRAFAGRRVPVMEVGSADLDRVFRSFQPSQEAADLVVFSGPQQSLYELRMLAELLEGKRVHRNTQLVVTTNHGFLRFAEHLGYARAIRQAGGLILEGVCFYPMGLAEMQAKHGWRTLVTNSAKVVNNVGAYAYEPVLRRTETCVRSALSGRIEEHP